MNHFTVLTDDVAATVDFYRDFIGLTEGPRPPLGFPGAWLYTGEQAVLHVVGGRPKSELRAGVIDHMASSAERPRATIATLDANGVKYQCRQQKGSGVWQVFLHDPNGARVELDFAPEEPAPRVSAGPPQAANSALGAANGVSVGGPNRPSDRRWQRSTTCVVAAATLADGIEYFAEITGVAPQPGGKHVAMGTHNALVRLSERTFLEIIAIDPAGNQARATAVVRARQYRPAGGARGAAAPHPSGSPARPGSSAPLRQRGFARQHPPDGARRLSLANHDTRRRPASGQRDRSTLIEWDVPQHPADSLPKVERIDRRIGRGASRSRRDTHGTRQRSALDGVLPVTYDRDARLAAVRTPRTAHCVDAARRN